MTGSMTTTYTDIDVRRVYSRLHADLQMIAESTGLQTPDWVDNVVFDLTFLAISGYLSRIEIVLTGANNVTLQAEVYTPSANALSWTAQRPSCRWPRILATALNVFVYYMPTYAGLTPAQRGILARQLKLAWGAASFRPDYSRLTAGEQRTYASNGYGLRRVSYS